MCKLHVLLTPKLIIKIKLDTKLLIGLNVILFLFQYLQPNNQPKIGVFAWSGILYFVILFKNEKYKCFI